MQTDVLIMCDHALSAEEAAVRHNSPLSPAVSDILPDGSHPNLP